MSTHSKYIFRCLQLAERAQGKTTPNPMVGSIIVCEGKIIGEGYHQFYGGAHAEVNAVAAVANRELLSKSTLYVSLEPCSHYGKTPPCTDLIIENHIPKVVVGILDPNPKVNGKGIEKLRNAGIEVIVGIEEEACRKLNRRFLTRIEKQRPYIILKWAQTADGFIDFERQNTDTEPLKISNGITKTLNHQLRTQEAAILVGTKTAFLDNPRLTVTKWTGKSPVRMFIDKNLVIPHSYNLFDNTIKTVIFNNRKGKFETQSHNIEFVKLDFLQNIIPQILDYLQKNKLESVIVEGGKQLLQSFIDQNLFDEVNIETSPQKISNGVQAPNFPKIKPCKTVFYGENRMDYFY
ncbi:MAG: bifunctional diaminohydroxyphosphoribosylaminopyrimidine deaminase/5-amino-6-(5-phosphoribosylamino)uracil reductase RibD [Prevotellaceae bacterium]|jgi:diaminohydroxyphosphoribosylaminopyrimidine deaminase/5-amino-6-(5-phosphoribosylamino)uracil reductase|nr:bifunctional diaminohydroxyphosphoribosylaminopyrimidine deaminase/5-amino-6-(5-phosphoribosylamino)uracil reductase RibD [Prevotellaceae bacterium]